MRLAGQQPLDHVAPRVASARGSTASSHRRALLDLIEREVDRVEVVWPSANDDLADEVRWDGRPGPAMISTDFPSPSAKPASNMGWARADHRGQ